jgi:hypothetical protein
MWSTSSTYKPSGMQLVNDVELVMTSLLHACL